MYQASARTLAPIFLLVFACTLLGLIAADPPPQQSAPLEPSTQLAILPWQPLADPPAAVATISALIESTPAKQRLPALLRVASDPSASTRARGLAAFAAGIEGLGSKSVDGAALAPFESPDIASTELSGYALYFLARELEREAPERAFAASRALISGYPDFARIDEARLVFARLLRSRGDAAAAVDALRPVTTSADETAKGNGLDAIARLYVELERNQEAVDALETLYYRLPRHKRAKGAGRRLTALRSKLPEVSDEHLYGLAFERAELLLAKRRYRDAYNAFLSLSKRFSQVADTDLVHLRMATAQYRRRQITASVANFKRVRSDALAPEALFYQGEVARRKRRLSTFREHVASLEQRFPKSSWTERGMLSLAGHLADNDEISEARSIYERAAAQFPAGERSLETKWHLFWDDFRNGRYETAATSLEEAARERPGASGLSRHLFWAGRAYQEAGRFDRADALLRQVLLGYQNSYYGRRALEHLQQMQNQTRSLEALEAARDGIDLSEAFRVERPARQRRVAELYALDLTKMSLEEAEAAFDGHRDEGAFRAIAAWIHSAEGRNLNAIIAIRDAFPFHVAATGDLLPRPIWKLFYPLPFRDHVEQYAEERGLDPFLVAALIRQESTFNPRVRSPANARGLMQIIPATGRQLARQEKRRYQTRDLYNPEINIRYGTRYLKEVLSRFEGRIDYALAGYNAGPHRVKRWTGMDMTIDPEVFIEEIPFPETRNYVKLVLRNEMLYRRLYGGAGLDTAVAP